MHFIRSKDKYKNHPTNSDESLSQPTCAEAGRSLISHQVPSVPGAAPAPPSPRASLSRTRLTMEISAWQGVNLGLGAGLVVPSAGGGRGGTPEEEGESAGALPAPATPAVRPAPRSQTACTHCV